MKIFKPLLGIVLLLLGGVGAYLGYIFFFQEKTAANLYAFIPEDFVLLIESDKPIQDWKTLSSSKVWGTLKESEYFSEITKSANSLDSLLKNNEKITKMANIGKLLISTHVTTKNNYDFLIALDLNDKGKLSNFKAILNPVFRHAGYKVSSEIVLGREVHKLYDSQKHTTLFLTLSKNVLLASYTVDLVKKSIIQSETGNILDNHDLKKVYNASVKDGNYSIFINYRNMNTFINVFTQTPSEMLTGLNESLTFSGATLITKGEEISMTGYSDTKDTALSYINAFRNAGKGKVGAARVLPQTTVLFTSIGFSDFRQFMSSVQNIYKRGGQKEWEDMMKKKKQLESYLKINIEDDFFSWMSEEACAAVIALPQSEGHTTFENLALLHFKKGDYENVREKLDRIMRQIKRKTPVKFEKEIYNGYEIEYLEMKGFFKLFFKKLFSKIEKPYFIILDDYVIFSNTPTSLKYLIDNYLNEKVLNQKQDFSAFFRNFEATSSVFTYFQNEYFYDYVFHSLDSESRNTLSKNQKAVRSFSHIGLQVTPHGEMLQNTLYTKILPWEPQEIPADVRKMPNDSLTEIPKDSIY